jgi:FkbM family methyltransferase
MESPFWVNEITSQGYWLKDYAHYLNCLPLCNFMDHGIGLSDIIYHYEINNDAPLIFKFSPRLVSEFKKVSSKPVYCVLNPFIHYRFSKKIQNLSEKGTLFFIAHSTIYIDDLTNWDEFIQGLNYIPEHFKPIDICLHPLDIRKGLGYVFSAKGYKVYSVGDNYPGQFVEDFYEILKKYKYSMSNIVGSYSFYSVEMGIPFSLYGKEPIYHNYSDPNAEIGAYTSYLKRKIYQRAQLIFNGLHAHITREQKEFVDFELGKTQTISRNKTCYLLYKALLIYLFKHPKYSFTVFISLIKKIWFKIKFNILLLPYILLKKTLKYKDWDTGLSRKKIIRLSEIFKLKLKYSNEEKSVSLFGKSIIITNSYFYIQYIKKIFSEEIYYFHSDNNCPKIIDCGASAGLSSIYFKRIYPASKMKCFEGNPIIYDLLKNNLHSLGYDDIQTENKIAWHEEKLLNFSYNESEGGRILEDTEYISYDTTAKIAAIRLKDLINEKVDCLKIKINNDSEIKVLQDCADRLGNVRNVFVEFFPKNTEPLQYEIIFSILKNAGFDIIVKKEIYIPIIYILARKK